MIEKIIRGKKFNVKVDGEGQFYVNFEDTVIKAETMKELESKLFKATRKKWNIEFYRWVGENTSRVWEGGKMIEKTIESHLCKGTVVGKHASNGNTMVLWEGQKKTEQDYSWTNSRQYLRLNADERDRYTAMKRQYEKLAETIEEFEIAHGIDLRDMEQEMADKEKRPQEEDQDDQHNLTD